MEPRRQKITQHLTQDEVEDLDAVFVTHSHHDHALDAPLISTMCNECKVYGSESYSILHNVLRGNTSPGSFQKVPKNGLKCEIDKFVVRIYQSSHVEVDRQKHPILHKILKPMQGEVDDSISLPLSRTDFKTGDVFGLHIHHKEHGNIVVATTAGAMKSQLENTKADIVFLSVGFLHESTDADQKLYWDETVEVTNPHTIVPIHWDNFAKNPFKKQKLQLSPKLISDSRSAIQTLQQKSMDTERDFLIMEYKDTISMIKGEIQ